ncbi:hypothetical protein ETH_00008240, partial [Eimeria tenella]
LVVGGSNRPLDTSICSEAIRHFTQQVEELRNAVEGQLPEAEETNGSVREGLGVEGADEPEEGGDDLLLGFEMEEAAANEAANAWEQQQQQQQQLNPMEQDQQQQQQQQEDLYNYEDTAAMDYAADEYSRPEDDISTANYSLLTATAAEKEWEALKGKGPVRRTAAAAAAAAAAADPAAAAAAAGKSQQLLAALDPFLVDMTNLNKPLNLHPLLKAERCNPPAPKPIDNIFVAWDMTSSPFAASPQQMVSLSLLAFKQIQFAAEGPQAPSLVDAQQAPGLGGWAAMSEVLQWATKTTEGLKRLMRHLD